MVTRRGRAVTFHPTLLALANHCAFEPVAAWPRRPEEKGSVERRVGFARTGFFAGCDITVAHYELNAAAWQPGAPGRTMTAFWSGMPLQGKGNS